MTAVGGTIYTGIHHRGGVFWGVGLGCGWDIHNISTFFIPLNFMILSYKAQGNVISSLTNLPYLDQLWLQSTFLLDANCRCSEISEHEFLSFQNSPCRSKLKLKTVMHQKGVFSHTSVLRSHTPGIGGHLLRIVITGRDQRISCGKSEHRKIQSFTDPILWNLNLLQIFLWLWHKI